MTTHDDSSHAGHGQAGKAAPSRPVILMIAALIGVYFIALFAVYQPANERESPAGPNHGHETGQDHAHVDHHHDTTLPSYFAVIPFVLLLGAIAIFPLMHLTEHWWESNLNRLIVAVALAAVTLAYYVFLHPSGGTGKALAIIEHSIIQDYIPFIVLLFSLYTISGGIRIEGDLAAHPVTNSTFIAIGGVLASFIGTTGAAMLLIRPLLETNRERKHVQHTVVFFIFVVCNCGGCLLPIGDPPLFLGYLKGVDFFWTMWNLWLPWLVTNAILIAIYFVWDHFVAYPRETKSDIRRDETQIRPLRISGLFPNALLLIGVIVSVAILNPDKPVPGTSWHAWSFLREIVQLGLVGLSLLLGSQLVREKNKFNYAAIIEVAALFVGIFICMQPAIEILKIKGGELGLNTPAQMFWATGSLSSVLDNAPTYLVFFQTAATTFEKSSETSGLTFAQMVSDANFPAAARMLIGISLGAVFMGAMTYIGNGPNFMVKAIAEQSGIRMPSFFGYVFKFSVPVLIPVFILVTLLFLL